MSAGGAGSPGGTQAVEAETLTASGRERRRELLAVEEPLGIRVVAERGGRPERFDVAVTMRTPGADRELALGFLFTEGVVTAGDAVARVRECEAPTAQPGSVVEVYLRPGVDFDADRFRRNVYTSSSCGICGRAAIEQVRMLCPAVPGDGPRIARETLWTLPARLRAGQAVFADTGGLHAAGLFDAAGELLVLREDVGRHNAVDKVIGRLLADDALPAAGRLLMVSGRVSFELVQKAALAGIPVLAAVGAPSSLAVELGSDLGMTIIGFLRGERCNVYCGQGRVEAIP
ncbi:MAG: formate dehydrogenase accessory sulfurtransferase FdhD [Acidobacteriota bacterium]|nr:formate dehydrogenase accessory sulfurtransferase FdhD [Acidobacteriota bacterium]MDH3522135.1 formate dehydrogenase accessory sulfurtransferase FdhD [Acidobacteriota bacterium]